MHFRSALIGICCCIASVKTTFAFPVAISSLSRPPKTASLKMTGATGGYTTVEEIYALMKEHKKRPNKIPTPVALAMGVVGVPIWLGFLLPLSVTYQLGKAALRPILPEPKGKSKLPTKEIPAPKTIIPRKERKYDIVLLGATGFTGKIAIHYLFSKYGVDKEVKWAVAGRSVARLRLARMEVSVLVGSDAVMNIDSLIVDTNDVSTIPDLVKDTRAVITTAGPFQQYGSSVVEACAKYGTHYADITGEVDWSSVMLTKWDKVAQSTGAKIISFCGHDSIPWDLSYYKASELLRKECDDELTSFTCYDEMDGSISGGTVATVMLGLKGLKIDVPKCEFSPLLRMPDGTKSPNVCKANNPTTLKKIPEGRLTGQYLSPFLMAVVNAAVVKRSNALLGSEGCSSMTYSEGKTDPDFSTAFVTFFATVMGITALLNPLTAYPIEKYLLPKPGEGPGMEKREKSYLTLTAEGVGVRGSKVECVMYFTRDVGYAETARMLVESGLSMALEESKLPHQEGGFWTPSSGMGDVLLNRLVKSGTYFASRVLEKK